MRRPLHVAYHQRYLDWQLGKGHPSNPIRATIAVTLLEKLVPDHRRVDHLVSKSIRFFARTALERVHTRDYIEQVVRGDLNGEANRIDPELGLAALTMFAGTQALVYELANADWAPSVSFNPQGAKHHAMPEKAAGFCVFNDMAWAADYAVGKGRRVGYLDWDAHHGDGVEMICRHMPAVTTYSIHEAGIFPGTGLRSELENGAWNSPLQAGDGDAALLVGVDDALRRFDADGVDTLLLATGADGLTGDPLSSLEYTLSGLCLAARRVGDWAAQKGVPIVVGGAGGYQPFDETPMAWAGVVVTLDQAFADHASKVTT